MHPDAVTSLRVPLIHEGLLFLCEPLNFLSEPTGAQLCKRFLHLCGFVPEDDDSPLVPASRNLEVGVISGVGFLPFAVEMQ